MKCPFPGMDPWLEHPSLWPDVHNSLIAAIRDELSPLVAPQYYVGLERRAYLLSTEDLVFVGRPDVSVADGGFAPPSRGGQPEATALEVTVPMLDEVTENYLEIREVKTGELVTVMELLSPANKLRAKGREEYLAKRCTILRSRTNLVEIDLLRTGKPMPLEGHVPPSDYRIVIAAGQRRPRAQLLVFGVRSAIPPFDVPLRPGDDEPRLDLGKVLHDLYARARFDLRLDYTVSPVPELEDADRPWAAALVARA